jgi:hypothetical protein
MFRARLILSSKVFQVIFVHLIYNPDFHNFSFLYFAYFTTLLCNNICQLYIIYVLSYGAASTLRTYTSLYRLRITDTLRILDHRHRPYDHRLSITK